MSVNIPDKLFRLMRPMPFREPMAPVVGETVRDLVGELMLKGRFAAETGDTLGPSQEPIGQVQGTRETRRLFLEILRNGIDLYSDVVLERIKMGRPDLYKTILVKAYGHVRSEKGFYDSINLEGNSEALSLLMLAHTLERQLFRYADISKIVRQAITAESSADEIEEAYQRIKRQESQIVCGGLDWHSEMIVYARGHLAIYHNRGFLRIKGQEIMINKMEGDFINVSLLKQIVNRFSIPYSQMTAGMPSVTFNLVTTAAPSKMIDTCRLRASKWGHCTHASAKAALFTLFALKNSAISYGLIQNLYKRFTKFHRESFDEVFGKHELRGLIRS